jgi:hypothetical protein
MLLATSLDGYAGFGMSTESEVWVPCAHRGPPPSHDYVSHILRRAALLPRAERGYHEGITVRHPPFKHTPTVAHSDGPLLAPGSLETHEVAL